MSKRAAGVPLPGGVSGQVHRERAVAGAYRSCTRSDTLSEQVLSPQRGLPPRGKKKEQFQ
jgi:hypothetical protein